jgi:hypothetical protein
MGRPMKRRDDDNAAVWVPGASGPGEPGYEGAVTLGDEGAVELPEEPDAGPDADDGPPA